MLGAGGHASVLADTIRAVPIVSLVCVLDADPGKWGGSFCGVPVRGSDDELPGIVREGVRYFVVGVGAAEKNGPRRLVYERAEGLGLKALSLVHPTAVCSPSAVLGEGVQVMPLAVVNAGCVLGKNVIVNTGAIVEHDCVIADHVHIAPRVVLGGGVRVGEDALLGMGASVMPGVTIGRRSIVGAGAVVVVDVAEAKVVAGVPARVVSQ